MFRGWVGVAVGLVVSVVGEVSSVGLRGVGFSSFRSGDSAY